MVLRGVVRPTIEDAQNPVVQSEGSFGRIIHPNARIFSARRRLFPQREQPQAIQHDDERAALVSQHTDRERNGSRKGEGHERHDHSE